MIKIVNADEMRGLDNFTINELGIPGIVLMENAGAAAANIIKKYLKDPAGAVVQVYCGKGNNGGDGYVIARYLYDAGAMVQVFIVASEEEIKGDALTNLKILQKLHIPHYFIQSIEGIESRLEYFPNLVVDALLGTGIDGAVRGFMTELIDYVNGLECPRVAIDVPSGLSANSGLVAGAAIRADVTITMALPKICQVFHPAKAYCGDLYIADIGIPSFARNDDTLHFQMVEKSDVSLPPRPANAHKYNCGSVGVVAGSPGYTGAAVLAARAAMRMGAGLVKLACPEKLNAIYESKLTEVITHIMDEDSTAYLSPNNLPSLRALAEWADVLVIGPGLGRQSETMAAVVRFLEQTDKPVVIDADALFALAKNPALLSTPHPNWILTPHFGEFARFFPSLSRDDLQRNFLKYAQTFAVEHQLVLLLKGAPSLVATPSANIYVNPTGNAGLATGGSGDVLSGLIAALWAQGLDAVAAALTANYLQGITADELVKEISIYALSAGDLIENLGKSIQNHF